MLSRPHGRGRGEFSNLLHSFPRVAVILPWSDLPKGKCVMQPDLHSTISRFCFCLCFSVKSARNSILQQISKGHLCYDNRWSRTHSDKIQLRLRVRFEPFCISFLCICATIHFGCSWVWHSCMQCEDMYVAFKCMHSLFSGNRPKLLTTTTTTKVALLKMYLNQDSRFWIGRCFFPQRHVIYHCFSLHLLARCFERHAKNFCHHI